MFNRIGTEIQNHDPHQRLRGIHDDNGTLPNEGSLVSLALDSKTSSLTVP
jgi:hypothetical protein